MLYLISNSCKNMLVRKLAFQMIAALLIIFSVMEGTLAQSAKEPIVTLLDYRLKPVNGTHGYSYTEERWMDNGQWHARLFSFPEQKLLADYFYKDSTRQTKEGPYLRFHTNGRLEDSGRYENGQREGIYNSWYDDGNPASSYTFRKNIPVDTCVDWYKEGTVKAISITDSVGDGVAQVHYPSGKLKEIGKLKAGLRQGNWLIKEESGMPMMEVFYEKDSVTAAICFDEKGIQTNAVCIYEKPAAFPGGLTGWRRFLETKLRYPEEAYRSYISGTVKVRFQVAKDGTLSEYEIVSSPHPSLSSEVLRLMRLSPKWEPAIQYNKPVVYRHIQSVTFRLQ
jgi:TonB family protein